MAHQSEVPGRRAEESQAPGNDLHADCGGNDPQAFRYDCGERQREQRAAQATETGELRLDNPDPKWRAWRLAAYLLRHPFDRIIIHARYCLPPSPWADQFRVIRNEDHKATIIDGYLT